MHASAQQAHHHLPQLAALAPPAAASLRAQPAIASPAAALLELAANTLDAGSTEIHAELDLQPAGLSLRVQDNGAGILAPSMRLLGQRFATSRHAAALHGGGDGAATAVLGGRGEALAMLREAAETVEVTSRAAGSFETYTVTLRPGGGPTAGAALAADQRGRQGTLVVVRGLFAAQPMRVKALVTAGLQREVDRCHEALLHLALLRPHVSVTLFDRGRRTFLLRLLKGRSQLDSIASFLGRPPELVAQLQPQPGAAVAISGYAGLPPYGHPSTCRQAVFVNGRWVKAAPLAKLADQLFSACYKANARLLQSGAGDSELQTVRQAANRHAAFVLHISCPPSDYELAHEAGGDLVQFRCWQAVTQAARRALLVAWRPVLCNSLLKELEQLEGGGTGAGAAATAGGAAAGAPSGGHTGAEPTQSFEQWLLQQQTAGVLAGVLPAPAAAAGQRSSVGLAPTTEEPAGHASAPAGRQRGSGSARGSGRQLLAGCKHSLTSRLVRYNAVTALPLGAAGAGTQGPSSGPGSASALHVALPEAPDEDERSGKRSCPAALPSAQQQQQQRQQLLEGEWRQQALFFFHHPQQRQQRRPGEAAGQFSRQQQQQRRQQQLYEDPWEQQGQGAWEADAVSWQGLYEQGQPSPGIDWQRSEAWAAQQQLAAAAAPHPRQASPVLPQWQPRSEEEAQRLIESWGRPAERPTPYNEQWGGAAGEPPDCWRGSGGSRALEQPSSSFLPAGGSEDVEALLDSWQPLHAGAGQRWGDQQWDSVRSGPAPAQAAPPAEAASPPAELLSIGEGEWMLAADALGPAPDGPPPSDGTSAPSSNSGLAPRALTLTFSAAAEALAAPAAEAAASVEAAAPSVAAPEQERQESAEALAWLQRLGIPAAAAAQATADAQQQQQESPVPDFLQPGGGLECFMPSWRRPRGAAAAPARAAAAAPRHNAAAAADWTALDGGNSSSGGDLPTLQGIAAAAFRQLAPATLSREQLSGARALAQVDRKFVPVVSGQGLLLLVDQHAADERVRLERLRGQLLARDGRPVASAIGSLRLRAPLPLDLTSAEQQLLEGHRARVAAWGWCWSAAPRGSSSAAGGTGASPPLLTHVPLLWGAALSATDLKLYLHHLAGGGGGAGLPAAVVRTLNSKACRGAIMFGDRLEPAECQALLEQLSATQLCFSCAHGRPTTVPLVDLRLLAQALALRQEARRAGGAGQTTAPSNSSSGVQQGLSGLRDRLRALTGARPLQL